MPMTPSASGRELALPSSSPQPTWKYPFGGGGRLQHFLPIQSAGGCSLSDRTTRLSHLWLWSLIPILASRWVRSDQLPPAPSPRRSLTYSHAVGGRFCDVQLRTRPPPPPWPLLPVPAAAVTSPLPPTHRFPHSKSYLDTPTSPSAT